MQTASKPVRVFLADDHQIVRLGLRSILARFPNIEIVGEASNPEDAVREVLQVKPDVVLMDVRMPGGSPFEACQRMMAQGEKTHVIFLSSFSEDEAIFQAISAGADGYLLKDIDAADLVNAIHQVAEGKSILDPSVTRRVLGRFKAATETAEQNGLEILSAQELRVIALVAQGKTNKEIGIEMGLSDKTVKNYLSNLLDKLKMSRRSQAAAFYVRETGKNV
jgi:two-component system response regulator DevR